MEKPINKLTELLNQVTDENKHEEMFVDGFSAGNYTKWYKKHPTE